MDTSPQMNFVRRLVYLNGQLIDFSGRPYLPALYQAALRQDLVVRASRQVEKSTLLMLMTVYWAATVPGVQILYVCPRMEQAALFAKRRLIPAIESSPILYDEL